MKQPAEPELVKNYLLKTLQPEKRIDNFTLGEGVMPTSFKVLYDLHRQNDILVADFGGSAIGRVVPIDSGFWWIILLRSYTKLILNLCLSDGFDTFPTLLCADGCSMIDRRMVSLYFKFSTGLFRSEWIWIILEIICKFNLYLKQGIWVSNWYPGTLLFFPLRCARQMLKPERDGKELIERIDKRITTLSYHIQKDYLLNFTELNNIYRYKNGGVLLHSY